MLTDNDRLMIAAGVDGSLSPEQAASFTHLMGASAEARDLAARLSTDRRRLSELPRLNAPTGFAERVDAKLPIIRVRKLQPSPNQMTWLPFVVAATVFLALMAGAYQLAEPRNQAKTDVVSRPVLPTRSVETPTLFPELAPRPQPVPVTPKVANQITIPQTEAAPSPRPVEPPAMLAAGLFREIDPPATLVTRLPIIGPVNELIPSDLYQRTADIWANGSAVRIDLFVPDVSAALPGVQAAAKGCGWAVSVDTNAQMLLKAKQHGAFALYLDAVSAADGGQFLSSLAMQGKAGAKLGVAHLSAAGAADHREIKDLLGADPKPTTKHPTAEQVSKIKKPTPKHTALLFALTPPTARPVATSKEVRAFADGRTTRKSGAVPLIVVIRTADGGGL